MEEQPERLHTITELREKALFALKSSKSASYDNALLLEALLHIYAGLDIMDSRLLQIEQHLASMDSRGSDDDWNREHNPLTYKR